LAILVVGLAAVTLAVHWSLALTMVGVGILVNEFARPLALRSALLGLTGVGLLAGSAAALGELPTTGSSVVSAKYDGEIEAVVKKMNVVEKPGPSPSRGGK
jgi:hypothetical protein